MRFKARFTKEQGQLLYQIMSSLERIAKGAVIHMSPETFRIAVVTDALAVDAPFGFASLEANEIFDELRIESASSNAILLKIEQLGLLVWAMSSVKQVSGLSQLKLVKRGDRPCLCFEARPDGMTDEGGMAVKVQHDIPIKVLPTSEIKEYMPPAIPPPDVSLRLPKTRIFRSVVEKCNKFGRHMIISGKQNPGSLTLRVEDSMIAIQTYLSPLDPIDLSDPENMNLSADNTRDEGEARIKIDIRKLSAVLNLQHLPWDHAKVYLSENAALLIEIELGIQSVVRFFVPVLEITELE